jgi:hypothetical protein
MEKRENMAEQLFGEALELPREWRRLSGRGVTRNTGDAERSRKHTRGVDFCPNLPVRKWKRLR